MLELAGKKFFVRRVIHQYDQHRKDAMEAIDKLLVDHMQLMLESILLTGAASVPDGEIVMRCASGELWRYHYEHRCGCKVEEAAKVA
jgi:20S proteasome alpha/beta subunit